MIIYLGIPIVFILFFLIGGMQAFKQEAQSQAQAYNPDKYRS